MSEQQVHTHIHMFMIMHAHVLYMCSGILYCTFHYFAAKLDSFPVNKYIPEHEEAAYAGIHVSGGEGAR